jgi:tetratricopeptide (TPR) repeat protein
MTDAAIFPPPLLVEQISRRRCVLFLGPDAAEGASGYRGLPTSWQLADALASACNFRGGYRPLAQIAQVYEHTLSRHSLVSYLRERLGQECYSPLPLHELIARLPFAAIVHAGWDGLLEQALEQQGVAYQRIYSAIDLPYALPERGLLLYKPYGSLDRPETLVITENDQLDVFYSLQTLKRRLAELIASYTLLMVGYAPDYDSVFVRIYHEIRHEQGEHRLPAFVLESLSRPEDAAQWEARGIKPLVAEPVHFLYEMAKSVVQADGRTLDLPDLAAISQAPPATSNDLADETAALNRVLEKMGVGALVEQSDVPLLSLEQVHDLEAMQAAYARLSATLPPTAESAQVWLRQGNVEYARQNFDNARRYYEKALQLQPDLAEAYHNLHYVYLAQNEWDAALGAYQQAIALQPSVSLLPSRYHVDKVLGRGGTGVVYRTVDQETGRPVAVKLLDRAFLRNEQALRRFRREADLLQRLSHPHIVHYLDFQHFQNRYFLVMEYLGEKTVSQLLAQEQHLPLDEAHAILQQVCQAVSFAHSQHIIHRDIKPANIFLVEGQAKLIDFGLAYDLAAGQPSLTGQTTGTVAYMAPEQMAGGPMDERTDIYALATVAYEMITGQNPGQGAYRPASELVPGINLLLDGVLEKARARNPADRYPSVAVFSQQMAEAIPLQAASRQSPLWRRALAHVQQGIRVATSSYWSIFLLAIALAGIRFPDPPTDIGVLLWHIFVLALVTDWFTAWLARNTGYPLLAANGPLLGLLLGLGTGMASVAMTKPEYFTNKPANWLYSDYLLMLLMYTVGMVIVCILGYLLIMLCTRLALRWRLSQTAISGLWLISALLIIGVYVLALGAMFPAPISAIGGSSPP